MFRDVLDEAFANYVTKLPGEASRLLSSAPLSKERISKLHKPGIYIFSEAGMVQYVGRTNNFRNRHKAHCHASSGENTAAFAFRLARLDTGNSTASYKKKGSRKELMKDDSFCHAFSSAKRRIAEMEVRFIEVADPNLQHLLELYVSLAFKSAHNSFVNT